MSRDGRNYHLHGIQPRSIFGVRALNTTILASSETRFLSRSEAETCLPLNCSFQPRPFGICFLRFAIVLPSIHS